MNCPNTKCDNNMLTINADYCSVCGFAISDKAKKELLEKEIARVNAERFKLTAENRKKDYELNLLKNNIVCEVQKIDKIPTSAEIFNEFNKKKEEKYKYDKQTISELFCKKGKCWKKGIKWRFIFGLLLAIIGFIIILISLIKGCS